MNPINLLFFLIFTIISEGIFGFAISIVPNITSLVYWFTFTIFHSALILTIYVHRNMDLRK